MALCGHWGPWLETWPAWGMSAGGVVFALPMPALLMGGSASSSSPTLATPRVGGMVNGPSQSEIDAGDPKTRLEVQVHLLPTPVADHSRGLPQPGTDYASLPNVAVSLLPTPRATDGTKGGPNQRGSSGDLMLPSAVQQLLPTPTVGNATGTNKARGGDRSGELLLPGVVLALLPTPTAAAIDSTPERWEARAKQHAINGQNLQRSLSAEVVGIATGNPVDLKAAKRPTSAPMPLLPTPTAQAAKHASDDRGPGTLDDANLWSIAARTSAPTPPPSDDGNTS